MAESDFYVVRNSKYRARVHLWTSNENGSSNTCTINFQIFTQFTGTSSYIYIGDWTINIDGQVRSGNYGKLMTYTNTLIASGSVDIGSANNRWVGVSAGIGFYNHSGITHSGSGGITCPTIVPPAVDPTPPNSVNASGGTNNWIDKDNPLCSVSWSGATNGTYTITKHNIDITKNNFASITTPYSVDVNGATSGSAQNVSLSSLGLSGGETVRLRVAMLTTKGAWMMTNWGGSFHIYSRPSAPTTFNVPSSQEIDTSFNVSWSGAKAGSEGINRYQLERRVYNGSSWGGWTRVVDKNTSSYTAGTPKSITGSNSDAYQIQFRIRTFDGHYRIFRMGYKNSKS